jgi:two-component system sensor histidine kinase/response regulator
MMNNAILMMVDKDAVGTEVYEMLQMMNKTTEEVFLLLDNLLKWAKRRLNKQRIFKQNVDIHEIIRSTASLYSTMAEQKKIRITTEGIDGEAIGFVDEDMMKTVVRNLVSNAMKFCFEGGEIHIASVQEGDFIHVSVKDNGKGIKKEDQAKVLDEDTHFTTFGTNNEKGSGLGLMLCKDFVMQHDGKLWFESEEGKGTTFHFTMKVFNQES